MSRPKMAPTNPTAFSNRTRCAIWFSFAVLPALATGNPANPFPVDVTQPDGSVLKTRLFGDEYQNWRETLDGYTVVKNPKSLFFEYAIKSPQTGRLVPSGERATSIRNRADFLLKSLRPENRFLQMHGLPQLQQYHPAIASSDAYQAPAVVPGGVTGVWRPHEISGERKLLLVLIDYQNARISKGGDVYWHDVAFSDSTPSVAKFYGDNSFGRIAVKPVQTHQGMLHGLVHVSLPEKHPNVADNYNEGNEARFIQRALDGASRYVDFAALDQDANGTIDVDEALIYFVLAGYETSAGSGLAPSIWGHRGGDTVPLHVQGKLVRRWALNGEMFNRTTRMQMGIVTHEMGHAMGGLPDLYDRSHTNAGLGAFSVMSFGSWGTRGNEIPGSTPVALDAWSRQYLGWSTPKLASANGELAFDGALSSPTASLMLINETQSTSEYWLVENRPPIGWDAGLSGMLGAFRGGLLIQHIDTNVGTQEDNSFNMFIAGKHQGNLLVRPSTAQCDLSQSEMAPSCPSLLYYSENAGQFNASSAPPSVYYSGAVSVLGISEISNAAESMTAILTTRP